MENIIFAFFMILYHLGPLQLRQNNIGLLNDFVFIFIVKAKTWGNKASTPWEYSIPRWHCNTITPEFNDYERLLYWLGLVR